MNNEPHAVFVGLRFIAGGVTRLSCVNHKIKVNNYSVYCDTAQGKLLILKRHSNNKTFSQL